jgi:hypothetical protein
MRLKKIGNAAGNFLLAGILAIPAFAQYGQAPYGQTSPQYNQTPQYGQGQAPNQSSTRGPAAPGTINYVEGQAELAGQALNQNSVGTQIQPGQTVTTQDGRAEILLTPGVLLRVDKNSAVMADSMELGEVHFTVQQGRAMVEADNLLKDDNIAVAVNGENTHLSKKGLYEFTAGAGQVRVWDGQVKVEVNGKEMAVDSGHQLAADANGKPRVEGFNKKTDEDAFYRWSSLRASYLAEANVKTAGTYAYGGPGWYGPGWYWSPWFAAYTWIPGDGIFWDPFGWGFFAPGFVGYAPLYGYGFYGRPGLFGPGYRPGIVAHGDFAGRELHGAAAAGGAAGLARGGFAGGGGVRGGFAGGGGFHGGGGGGGGRR